MRRNAIALCAAVALACGGTLIGAPAAAAKGTSAFPVPSGITLPGSPFRFQTLAPQQPRPLTVVARINREGGRISRWWSLPGDWFVPGVTPSIATGLAADGSRLVLVRQPRITPEHAAPDTELAIVRPQVKMRRSADGFPHWVDFVRLPNEWRLLAISPDGATLFLSRYRNGVERIRPGLYRPTHPGTDDLEVRALDTTTGELLPGRVREPDGPQRRLDGLAWEQVASGRGRWTYTLFAGDRQRPFIYALDGIAGHGSRIDLPHLRGLREPYAVHLEVEDAGRSREVVRRWFPDGRKRERTLATVDTHTFHVRRPQAQASATSWVEVVGRSAGGREIRLKQLGDPALDGRLLVFGCIHGDECAARGIEPLSNGCPDPDSNIYLVPTLDPDGAALGTRLNGRGVDLNHNFAVGWRPIGQRWDPQYAGPRPFSEPETRLAARIVRAVEPRATIWFHQHHGPGAFVRAWGPAIPLGSRFAALAGIKFLPLPWLAGTAPRWQNNAFPGSASFVVELPPGELRPGLEERLEQAVVRVGREVGED